MVKLEELSIHAGLVIVALEVGLRREGEEVGVAGVVLREQRQVIWLLVTRLAGVA